MILRLAILVQYWLVMDRQTDTRPQHIPCTMQKMLVKSYEVNANWGAKYM